MKHSMIIFTADKEMNRVMRSFDMCPEYKWFIETKAVEFDTSTVVDDDYFVRLINKSKEAEESFWIPAIKYQDNFYHHPDVKILSDGKKEMFI